MVLLFEGWSVAKTRGGIPSIAKKLREEEHKPKLESPEVHKVAYTHRAAPVSRPSPPRPRPSPGTEYLRAETRVIREEHRPRHIQPRPRHVRPHRPRPSAIPQKLLFEGSRMVKPVPVAAEETLRREIESALRKVQEELEVARPAYVSSLTRELVKTKEALLRAAKAALEKGKISLATELMRTAEKLTHETSIIAGGEPFLRELRKFAETLEAGLRHGLVREINTRFGKVLVVKTAGGESGYQKISLVPLISPDVFAKYYMILKKSLAARAARAARGVIVEPVTPEELMQSAMRELVKQALSEAVSKITSELRSKFARARELFTRALAELKSKVELELNNLIREGRISSLEDYYQKYVELLNKYAPAVFKKYEPMFRKLGFKVVVPRFQLTRSRAGYQLSISGGLEPLTKLELEPIYIPKPVQSLQGAVTAWTRLVERAASTYRKWEEELHRYVQGLVKVMPHLSAEQLQRLRAKLSEAAKMYRSAGLYSLASELESAVREIDKYLSTLKRIARETSPLEAGFLGFVSAFAPTAALFYTGEKTLIKLAKKVHPALGALAVATAGALGPPGVLVSFETLLEDIRKTAEKLGVKLPKLPTFEEGLRYLAMKLKAIKEFGSEATKTAATVGASVGSVLNVFQGLELLYSHPAVAQRLRTAAEIIHLRRGLQPTLFRISLPLVGSVEVKPEDIASIIGVAALTGGLGAAARGLAGVAPRLALRLSKAAQALETYFSLSPESWALKGLSLLGEKTLRGVGRLLLRAAPRIEAALPRLGKLAERIGIRLAEIGGVKLKTAVPVATLKLKPVRIGGRLYVKPELRIEHLELPGRLHERVVREFEKFHEELLRTPGFPEHVSKMIEKHGLALVVHGRELKLLPLRPERLYTVEDIERLLGKEIARQLRAGRAVTLSVYSAVWRRMHLPGTAFITHVSRGRPRLTIALPGLKKETRELVENVGARVERGFVAVGHGGVVAGARRVITGISHKVEYIAGRGAHPRLGRFTFGGFRVVSFLPGLPQPRIYELHGLKVESEHLSRPALKLSAKVYTAATRPEHVALMAKTALTEWTELRGGKIVFRGVEIGELRPPRPRLVARGIRPFEIRSTELGKILKVGGVEYRLTEVVRAGRGRVELKPEVVSISEREAVIRTPEGVELRLHVGREGVYLETPRGEKVPVSGVSVEEGKLKFRIENVTVEAKLRPEHISEARRFAESAAEVLRVRYLPELKLRHRAEVRTHELKPPEIEAKARQPGERRAAEIKPAEREAAPGATLIEKPAELKPEAKPVEVELRAPKVTLPVTLTRDRIRIGEVDFKIKVEENRVVFESEPIKIVSREDLRRLYDFCAKLEYVVRYRYGKDIRIRIEPAGREGIRIVVEAPLDFLKMLRTHVAELAGGKVSLPVGRTPRLALPRPELPSLTVPEVTAKTGEKEEEKTSEGSTPGEAEIATEIPELTLGEAAAIVTLLTALGLPVPPWLLKILVRLPRGTRRRLGLPQVSLPQLLELLTAAARTVTVAPRIKRFLVI